MGAVINGKAIFTISLAQTPEFFFVSYIDIPLLGPVKYITD
jgi:hypothetical protein